MEILFDGVVFCIHETDDSPVWRDSDAATFGT